MVWGVAAGGVISRGGEGSGWRAAGGEISCGGAGNGWGAAWERLVAQHLVAIFSFAAVVPHSSELSEGRAGRELWCH